MDLIETKQSLKRQLGRIGATDKYHYDLLIDAYDDYFLNRDILGKGDGDTALIRIATKEKNEAKQSILLLLKHFGIAPRDRSKDQQKEVKSELEAFL